MRRYYWFVLAFVAWCAAPAHAAVPEHITLSAQIFEADSADAKSYQGAVTVELFASETGGTALWSELHPDRAIERGFLSLPLGALNTTTPLAAVLRAHAGEELYIGVSVTPSGGAVLSFPKRLPITSVPYALVCGSAANAQTLADKPLEYFAAVGASFTKAESDARYLAIDAPAKDAAMLGGQLPNAFAPSAHTHDASYLGKTAQAEDAKKLGGQLPGYFATQSGLDLLAANLDTLSGNLADYYYSITQLATHFFSKEELLPADANTPGALDSRYPFLAVGQTSNCRLDYSGTTLAVKGRNGQDLSSTNVCVVAISDHEPLVFKAPAALSFGADSDTTGNSFGSTVAANWDQDRPFFLAACRGSSKPFFVITLNAVLKSTGNYLCLPASQDCNSENSALAMDATLTPASEGNKFCAVVGSFRATKTYSNLKQNWLVSPLTETADGFGKFQEGVDFKMPKGQNGAASATQFFAPATAPVSAQDNYYYSLDRWGKVRIRFHFPMGTNGTAADNFGVALPYRLNVPYFLEPVGYFFANSNPSSGLLFLQRHDRNNSGTLFGGQGPSGMVSIFSDQFPIGTAAGTYLLVANFELKAF